jgi:hypothetical protein
MKVRSVLLDADFIGALVDAESPDHARAADVYRAVIDGYTAGANRLFALSTVLSGLDKNLRRGLLAPVETVHVAGQHRSAARKVRADVSPDTALTLVMIAAEKIRTVATFADDLVPFDVVLIRDTAPDPSVATTAS